MTDRNERRGRGSRTSAPRKNTNSRERKNSDKGRRNSRGSRSSSSSSNSNKNILIGVCGLIVLVLLGMFLANGGDQNDPTVKSGWYKYSANESFFQIHLPKAIKLDTNFNKEQHLYAYNYKDRTFMIIFTKYSFLGGLTAYSEDTSNAVLNSLVEKAIKYTQGSVISKKQTKLRGYSAIDVSAQASDSTYTRMMNVLTPKGSYSIGISSSNKATLNDQMTNTFIYSAVFN